MRLLVGDKIVPENDLLEWARRDESHRPDWITSIANTLIEWYDDSSTVSIFTSGSTGAPKEILLQKSAMRVSARLTIDYFDLKQSLIAMLCLPAQYIAGKMMIIRAIISNMDLICVEPSSTPLRGVYGKVDFIAMTPYQVNKSIDADLDTFENVAKVIVGGATVSPYLKSKLQGLKSQFYQTYGMTETITHIALQRLNGPDVQDSFEVLPGIKFKTRDGCLVISAEHLDAEIRTTDIVELTEKGQFIWLGRADHTINSGGVKLQPEVIEKKMEELVSSPFVILGEKDDLLGERVVLMIADSEDQKHEKELWAGLRSVLNKYELPKKIYFVDELIETPTGKVKRDRSLYRV